MLVVVGPDGKLPTEVRLFKQGWNETEKGPFLFDEKAAESVLAHQTAMGSVDRMIDLEHLSLDQECKNYDPDPRAWCRLAVRNGELWAVGIVWLADGQRRIEEKKQRYLSPVFPSDDEGRIVFILNVAMTALPATHDAPALIAASVTKGRSMNPKFIALAGRFAALQKLADEAPPEAAKGKAAAVSEAASAAQDALEAYMKAASGSDIDATFAALDSAKMAVDAFENAANALVGAPPEPAEMAVEPPPAPTPAEEKALRALAVAKNEVTKLRADNERRELQIAEDRRVVENAERKDLVGQLVVLGVITPAQAWANTEATIAKGTWAKLSLGELKEFIKERGGSPVVPGNVKPAALGAVQSNVVNVSEYQINRLRATHDREKQNAPGAKHRDFDTVLRNYISIGEQQVRGARDDSAKRRYSRELNQCDVLSNVSGQFGHSELVTLSNPVTPIQQFGASSQRSLEEFRLEFNSTLVSLPIAWAEELGQVLPGGSLRDTYPLSFYAMEYAEKTAQSGPAAVPNSVDVTVDKKLFTLPAMAELIRITRGDFAYVQTWQQNAAHMARARIYLRNTLVTKLLEAGTTGYWGTTLTQPTGIDGQPFFSATHKVNPFDPMMKLNGSATWGNYAASATPLSAANLTARKAAMLNVPAPNGRVLGSRATGILVPTALDETARLLLTVQDLILGAASTLNGVSNVMAQVKNEHYQSGFQQVWGAELAGTSAAANYYLFSKETIGRGLPPWVIAEDAAEELIVWDEASDFYKDTKHIKIESSVYCNAALLYPHGIQYVKGA